MRVAARALLECDPIGFEPEDDEELTLAMAVPLWRLSHLYKIMIKSEGDDSDEGLVITFVPNAAQQALIDNLWFRNIILKARQLGFTTFIAILFLDNALFTDNLRCGMIAQNRDAAETIFRDKVKFAYDRLPEELRRERPLQRESASELLFSNNSSIRVATSLRSGTIHCLHVSEFGKICAEFPKRANEVVTGSIPAVPNDGLIFIESTAEGREGAFYDMTQRAEANHNAGKKLTRKDYRFHFFPWHEAAEYQMDPDGVVITEADHEYFGVLESLLDKEITLNQRAWYVATRDTDFAGDDARMWQEYPSTPEEAFKVSQEGCYFVKQMAAARKEKRITKLPILDGVPCFTFWDIGNSDGTAIWVLQRVGSEWRCVDFYEAWGETYSHATQWLQSRGYQWDTMYLPHDADHVRQGQTANKSPRMMLQELMPGCRWEVVPRIEDINWGIQQTRGIFPMLHFDEERCKEGIDHLDSYRKKWNALQAVWSDQPDKAGGHSEAADALRQFAQAYEGGLINLHRKPGAKMKRARNWRTA